MEDRKYKNKCCVPDCKDRESKRHRFPSELGLVKRWLQNINCAQLGGLTHDELRSKYVCNVHFADEYIVPGTRRGLRVDAVPTLRLSREMEDFVEKRHHEIVEECVGSIVTDDELPLPVAYKLCSENMAHEVIETRNAVSRDSTASTMSEIATTPCSICSRKIKQEPECEVNVDIKLEFPLEEDVSITYNPIACNKCKEELVD